MTPTRSALVLARRVRTLAALLLATGCGWRDGTPAVTVFAAGSLARPLRAAADRIEARTGTRLQLEFMGSLDAVRAITELGRTPDLVILADADVLEERLVPRWAPFSATIARNRVVLALSPALAAARRPTAADWTTRVLRDTLRIARADPARAPLGYRTEMVWQLAERAARQPGLAAALARRSPPALMRPSEADLAALLESGEADAAWCYESLARALELRYVTLGDAIDLGARAQAERYATATVRIPGATPRDSITVRGMPIRYAMTIPLAATRPKEARAVFSALHDPAIMAILRREGLDMLDQWPTLGAPLPDSATSPRATRDTGRRDRATSPASSSDGGRRAR